MKGREAKSLVWDRKIVINLFTMKKKTRFRLKGRERS